MARRKITGRKMADGDDADSYTIPEFCRRNRISVALFYKYPHLMPDTFFVGKSRRVGAEAGARWRAEREAASLSPKKAERTAGEILKRVRERKHSSA
jgi:hypothetical protein